MKINNVSYINNINNIQNKNIIIKNNKPIISFKNRTKSIYGALAGLALSGMVMANTSLPVYSAPLYAYEDSDGNNQDIQNTAFDDNDQDIQDSYETKQMSGAEKKYLSDLFDKYVTIDDSGNYYVYVDNHYNEGLAEQPYTKIKAKELEEAMKSEEYKSLDKKTVAAIIVAQKTLDYVNSDSNSDSNFRKEVLEPIKDLANIGLSGLNADNTTDFFTALLKGEYINGEIESSKQGKEGDCWLLSSLNTMSNSEKGRKIIFDSITKNPDQSYSIHFKGVNTTITISDKELEESRKSKDYSTGDTDVLLIEVATRKVMDKILNNEVDAPAFLKESAKDGENSICGGNLRDMVYLFTGDYVSEVLNTDHVNDDSLFFTKWFSPSTYSTFKKLKNNLGNYAITLVFEGKTSNNKTEDAVIKDVNGKDIILAGNSPHVWSLKDIKEDGKITIVNPWEPSDITVDIKEMNQYLKNISYYKYI